MECKFLRRGTRRPDVRSLRRVVANTPGHVSPAMLAGIQNPCPVGERDINALLPKRRAKLGRKLIQHGLDGRIGEMPSTCRNGHAQSQTRSEAVGHNAISYRPLDKAVSHLHVRASKFGWTTFALRGRKRSCRGVPLKSKLDDDFASRNRVVMLTSERDRHGYRYS
jgi:hypothetical protein